MATNNNPISDASAAIWSLLATKSDFLALFPANTKHQVRYTTALTHAPDPDLDEANPADYPRCRVLMRRARPGTERDSNNSYLDAEYVVEVCTGSQNQTVLENACWAIYRAMLGWRTYVRDVVQWHSTACIYDVDATELEVTDKEKDRNRGTQQWITVWSTTVRFYFATANLLAH